MLRLSEALDLPRARRSLKLHPIYSLRYLETPVVESVVGAARRFRRASMWFECERMHPNQRAGLILAARSGPTESIGL